ncbi:MAG: hypothetical protein J5I50_00420 [Chitinophagaceae bacterium]|nr:hypothetical protein [Chitinophagaceae bacterium]
MRHFWVILLLTIFSLPARAQRIVYSQPDNNDTRSLNFEIIGKLKGNYLIYKNVRTKFYISVYDRDMSETDRVDLKFVPDKLLNVDFIAYPDYAWMIYQYQKKNIVYCNAVKINSDGKLMTDPIELDTSSVNFFANNKIYSTIHSEDKKQIMVFKIQKRSNQFSFTTLLLDENLNLKHRSRIESGYEDKKYVFSDFLLSNAGNFVFTAGNRSSTRDYIEHLDLITKGPYEDEFTSKKIDLGDKFVDDVKIKIDNLNTNYILNSFYYLKKRGNAEGLFTAVIDEETDNQISGVFAKIDDSMRASIKKKGSDKTALNDFFIRNVILKRDGGFLLMAEDFYTQSRYNSWNRWDYLYGYPSYFSPYYYYYSPYYYNYYNYYGSPYGYGRNDTRYYYNNILVASLDSTGKYQWTAVVQKSQYDDESDNFMSYALMITGGKLHFLFNENMRRNLMLNEWTINGEGDVTRNPPMHNLDRGYDFMPRYAKQVSASEVIVPCMYRNYICFAKVQF